MLPLLLLHAGKRPGFHTVLQKVLRKPLRKLPHSAHIQMIGVIKIRLIIDADLRLFLLEIQEWKAILLNDLPDPVGPAENHLHSGIVLLKQMRRADKENIRLRVFLRTVRQEASQRLFVGRIQLLRRITLFIIRNQRSCGNLPGQCFKAPKRQNAVIVRSEMKIVPDRGSSAPDSARLIGMIRIKRNQEPKRFPVSSGFLQIRPDHMKTGPGKQRQMQGHPLHCRLVHVILFLLRCAVESAIDLNHHHIGVLKPHGLIQLRTPYLNRISVDGKRIARNSIVLICQPGAVRTADITCSDQHNVQRVLRFPVKSDDPVLIIIPVDIERLPCDREHRKHCRQKRQHLQPPDHPYSVSSPILQYASPAGLFVFFHDHFGAI